MNKEYKIDYKLPSEILKELKIKRHQSLQLYYTNREERREEFDKIMSLMEDSIIEMEKEMITNPYRRESIIHILANSFRVWKFNLSRTIFINT